MTFVSIRSQIRDRLWTLLEAQPQIVSAVGAGNRTGKTSTNEAGWLKALFWGTDPATYPQIQMSNGRWTNTAFGQDMTFATENATFLQDYGRWPLQRIINFQIVVVSRDQKAGTDDELEEAVQWAFINGGPKLGLAYVTGWSMNAEEQERKYINGTVRLSTRIKMPITCMFEGSDFLR